jgi:DNA helicase-2/ATP-dependent DNA helicase PcrA
VLAEAVARLRAGKVIRDAGYDGEYGVIRLFEPDELRRRTAGGMLFESPPAVPVPVVRESAQAKYHPSKPPQDLPTPTPNPSPQGGGETQAAQGGGDTHAAPASDVLSSLDADQRAAASVVKGPLLIVAGPGSGKTRTLVHRIAHLVADCGVAGAQCLAITFTRRAAAEMRERLHAMLGPDAGGIAVHTFHSLGLAMLREHAAAAGLTPGFRVAGEAEREAALAAALGLPRPRAENLIRAISKAERSEALPNGEIAAARTAYRAMLAANDWTDFDDLVGLAVRLLADNAEIAALYRTRFRFVRVDEFQDVDARQYRLLTLLTPRPAGNLCVIGDPHQAIYGFRGADAACFERFGSDYPGAATIALRRNYRSGGTIVAASSQVIAAHADEAIAEIVRERRERITIHAAPSERAEAEFVVITIEQAIGGSSFFAIDSSRTGGLEAALSFADFAVLYRTDAQAAVLCEALARSGIPFRRHSHAPLAQEPSVGALLEAFAAMAAADIDLATRLRQSAARAAAETGEAAAVERALELLLPLVERCGGDPARFLDAVGLASDADFWDERAEGVALLTLHAAKGLEFACVFIVGLEDGVLPLHWGRAEEVAAEELAEERRLFYVGMTRAKDRLVLSHALKRLWRGRVHAQAPSPFLADIESELVKEQRSKLRRGREDRQLKLL